MPGLLRVVRRRQAFKVGEWVRLRTSAYKGDVARISQVADTRNMLELQVIPRIDFSKFVNYDGERKRKKRNSRPPQALFNPDEIHEKGGHTEQSMDDGFWQFDNKQYDENGFLIMNVQMNRVDTDGVKPSVDELRLFDRGQEEGVMRTSSLNHNPFAKGDKVEVRDGDLINLVGTVQGCAGDTVIVLPNHESLKENLEFDFRSLAKKFMSSDHVRVTQPPPTEFAMLARCVAAFRT